MSTSALLELCLGRADPAIRMRLAIVDQWLDLWRSSEYVRRRVESSWPRIRAKLEAYTPGGRWRFVRGPISGIVVTLLDLGWVPSEPTCWFGPAGDAWALSLAPSDDRPFKEALITSIKKQLYSEDKYLSQGLGELGDFAPARQLLKKLTAKGDFKAKGHALQGRGCRPLDEGAQAQRGPGGGALLPPLLAGGGLGRPQAGVLSLQGHGGGP